MTDATWTDIRSDLALQYGNELPGPTLEADLVTLFENYPTTFKAEAARAANAYRDGKIRSPWAILRTNLAERVENDQRFAGVTANTAGEREHAIRRSERWVANAGLNCPTADDMLNELFGITDQTADLAVLEQIELETRAAPGRALYGGLLRAAIERTSREGPQPIIESTGPLTPYDTPELRQHFTDRWQALQPRANQARSDELDRTARHTAGRLAALAARQPDERADDSTPDATTAGDIDWTRP